MALGRRRSSESIVSKDSLSHGGRFLIRGLLLQASLVSRVGRPRFQGVLVRRAMPSSSLLAARPATHSSPCLLGRPSMRSSQIIRVHGNGRSFVNLYPDRRATRWLDERLRLSAGTHKNPSGSRLLSPSLLHLRPLECDSPKNYCDDIELVRACYSVAQPSSLGACFISISRHLRSRRFILFTGIIDNWPPWCVEQHKFLLSYAHFLVANCRCNVQASAPANATNTVRHAPASSLAAFDIH